jgi:uncharacterized membrane protein YoaK (UPF0700 family)
MRKVLSSDRFTTLVLSWVAGYVDTTSFLNLNGLFTAHVTGNLVVAGAEIAGAGGEAVWVRLAVIPVFMAAVILTTIISRTRQPHLSSFLWLEAATLLVFTIVSIISIPPNPQPISTVAMFVAGSMGIFSMGVQNALMREVFGNLAPTTVMTGNLTQFTIDFAWSILVRSRQKDEVRDRQMQEVRQRINKFGSALIGFVLGAAFGAYFSKMIGFWSVLLPTGAIVFLALNARYHETHSSNAT